MAVYRRVDDLRADCLYTGISSGGQRLVTSIGSLCLFTLPVTLAQSSSDDNALCCVFWFGG